MRTSKPRWADVGFVAGCLVFTTGLFAASGVFKGFVSSLLALLNASAASLGGEACSSCSWSRALVRINMRGVRNGARVSRDDHHPQTAAAARFRRDRGVFRRAGQPRCGPTCREQHGARCRPASSIFAFSGIEGANRAERRSQRPGTHSAARDPAGAGRGNAPVSGDSVRRARHHGTGSCATRAERRWPRRPASRSARRRVRS